MPNDFFPFPNLAFVLVFAAALIGWLCVASYHDLKTLIVPKKVTLSLLAGGVVINLVRGIWLGATGAKTWLLADPNGFLGGLDGFLFAFLGFLSGFTLFFVLWIFGVCGGGDVKLAAALGAWVGPKFLVFILGLALIAIFALTVVRIILAVTRGKTSSLKAQAGDKKKKGQPAKRVQWRLMSYSLPLTVGVAAFFVIGFWKQISALWNAPGA